MRPSALALLLPPLVELAMTEQSSLNGELNVLSLVKPAETAIHEYFLSLGQPHNRHQDSNS
jgi:hypothetical protein